jgi:hypothetical protein
MTTHDDGDSLGIETPPAKPRTQANRLREIGEGVRLFHTPTNIAYADIPTKDGDIDTCLVRSPRFKQWMTYAYYKRHGGGFSANAWPEARDVLESIAIHEGDQQEVYLRVAYYAGALYLDLCDPERRVVRINRDGWDIIPAQDAPVRFRRTDDMLACPLPVPVGGGSLDDLFNYINVPDEEGRVLVRGFLLNMLHPDGPYADLAITGEQGSAKSAMARYIRSIVDPSSTPTTRAPKDGETVYLQGFANWCPAFDNAHALRDDLADDLCQLATGGGWAKRSHYENLDMTTLSVKRPFILTSITDVITQPDLLDRTMTVRLLVIPDDKRRDEKTLNADFAKARPAILGALLDAAVCALANWETVTLPELPRMADLAIWVTAAEPAMGRERGEFVRVVNGNKVDSYQAALDASPVAQAVIKLMRHRETWSGTPTELEAVLRDIVRDQWSNVPRNWPLDAARITSRLKEAQPALRAKARLEVDFRHSGGNQTTITALDAVDDPKQEFSPVDAVDDPKQGFTPAADAVDDLDDDNRGFTLLEEEELEVAFSA